MSTNQRWAQSICVLVACVLGSACQDDTSEPDIFQTPEWEISNVTYADNVVVLEPQATYTLDATTGTVLMDSTAANNVVLEPGDILMGTRDQGMLRRILSVALEGDTLRLETEAASLTEAFESLHVTGSVPFDFATVMGGNPSLKNGELLSVYDETLYDDGTLSVTLENASIAFQPTFTLELEIGWFTLEYFRIEVGGQLDASMAVAAAANASIDANGEVVLLESPPWYITIPLPIGALVFEVTLGLAAGVDATLEGGLEVSAGADFSLDVRAGAEFREGQWHLIAEQTHTLQPIGPTLTVTAGAELRPYLRPYIRTELYGLVGPEISIEPFARLDLNLIPELNAELFAGVDGRIDCVVEAFDWTIVDYHESITFGEWSIWSQSLECVDLDGDGQDGRDPVGCPGGTDECDDDDDNWTGDGCWNCFDSDEDGYGSSCDRGPDCDDTDATIWSGCQSTGWQTIESGVRYSCGLATDQTLWCWGMNTDGQLGDSTLVDKAIPTAVDTFSTLSFVDLSASRSHTGGHTCALSTTGGIFCWGTGTSGQLGNTQSSSQSAPVPVQALPGTVFVEVSAGGSHSCGLDNQGTVWCWGANGYGQLGDGTTNDRASAQPLSGAGGTTFLAVAAGMDSTCALDTSHQAWCWGRGDNGQLGDGSTGASHYITVPVAVTLPPGRTFNSITGGELYYCAVDDQQQAWCWGVNWSGQLGTGLSGEHNVPTAVAMPTVSFSQVSASSYLTMGMHTCAIDTAGDAWCWGQNAAGQLGNGVTGGQEPTPVAASLAPGVQAMHISAGGMHTCVVDASGQGWCWGKGDFGQLGDGNQTDSNTPVSVPTP